MNNPVKSTSISVSCDLTSGIILIVILLSTTISTNTNTIVRHASRCTTSHYSLMSNLLSIPFKKTYPIEIKDATRAFISAHGGVHPDEFREDIISWQHLRKKATSDTVHENGIDAMLLSVSSFLHCDSHPHGSQISCATCIHPSENADKRKIVFYQIDEG